MSDLMTTSSAEPRAAAEPARRVGRRPGVLLLAAAVTATAAATGWWGTHPTAYADTGASITGELPPPGGSLLVGLGPRPAEGTVTLAEVTPVVTGNTADARIVVLVCDRPRGGLPPGVVRATAAEYCGAVADVDGYVHTATRGGVDGPTAEDVDGHLVVQITPAGAGEVAIRGACLRYRDGLQSGTQTTGAELTFVSR